MQVPLETKDPVVYHHPTRKSVGYFHRGYFLWRTSKRRNRVPLLRLKNDFLLYVNGPDVQEALAIVDTVLRRRGYELHKAQERDAVPIDNWYRHPNSGSGSVKSSTG